MLEWKEKNEMSVNKQSHLCLKFNETFDSKNFFEAFLINGTRRDLIENEKTRDTKNL